MLTCPISTLKAHSAGDRFEPSLKANARYQLESAGGRVLCGFRGNPYNFKSEATAANWLKTNLQRFKNATEPTSAVHVGKLHKIYAETLQPFVMDEIEAIASYERGEWQIIIDNESNELTVLDGGNAWTEY